MTKFFTNAINLFIITRFLTQGKSTYLTAVRITSSIIPFSTSSYNNTIFISTCIIWFIIFPKIRAIWNFFIVTIIVEPLKRALVNQIKDSLLGQINFTWCLCHGLHLPIAFGCLQGQGLVYLLKRTVL